MADGDGLSAGLDLIAGIDWSQPWFEPWAPWGQPVSAAVAAGQPLCAALQAGAAQDGPRFVAAQAAAMGLPYEAHVFAHGQVPTRDNPHDFFNALAWQRFAGVKAWMNARHAQVLSAADAAPAPARPTGQRGPLRDALTLLDENGLFLLAPAALCAALAARDWAAVFVHGRALWAQADVVLFGHALLDKLRAPRKDITAHVCLLPDERWPDEGLPDESLPGGAPATRQLERQLDRQLDRRLLQWLQAQDLAAKPFVPLPVLGIPGWCAANAHPAFYDDPRVFRTRPFKDRR